MTDYFKKTRWDLAEFFKFGRVARAWAGSWKWQNGNSKVAAANRNSKVATAKRNRQGSCDN